MHILPKSFLLVCVLTSVAFTQSINVAVAANVSYAIEDIKIAFMKKYPDTRVKIILGSSGKLTAQIVHGAPYDVFMSANMLYPNTLYSKGLTQNKPVIYAQGGLSLLSKKSRDFSKGLDILLEEDISRIAVGNPITAPYGKASFEALKNANILEKVKKKIVYGESISQTLSYTIKATDIGIVASSALYSPKLKRFSQGIHWQKLNTTLYTPIDQGIVVLKRTKSSAVANDFYNFILGDTAKAIFLKYGYNTL